MREVVAKNVENLLAYHYSDYPNITQRMNKLEEEFKIPFTTVQRIINQGGGGNLETLESVALAFELSPYQLLIPSLNPKNPQVVKGATKDEQRLYRQWAQKARIPAKTPEKVS